MIKTLKNTTKEIYNYLKDKVVRFKNWLVILIFGSAILAAGTQPITPEEIKWKDFTDNLMTIEYRHQGKEVKELKNLKGIWKPTEQEFEDVYKYVYGFDMVMWQKADGTEMCVNPDGSRENCISHWGQEFENAKEKNNLRGGIRKNEVNGDAQNIQLSKKQFDLKNWVLSLFQSVYAGIEFYDTFSGDAETELSLHSPDTGSGWTLLLNRAELLKASDSRGDVLSCVSTAASGQGSYYQTDDTMSYANYIVKIRQINGDSGDDTNMLICRIQDVNNMYALRWNESDADLYKKVSGAWSTIDTSASGIADNSYVELICEGTSISVEDDGAEILSAIDDSHSLAGKAGVGMGETIVTNDDCSFQSLDYFTVIVSAAPPSARRMFLTQ